jgi:hypothetical protein
MFKAIYRFFDKLEDRVRGALSHYPILYAFIAGSGIVLFWRGVWYSGDVFMAKFIVWLNQFFPDILLSAWDGPLTLLLAVVILLLTGVFVSQFLGNEIIISGLKGDKKVAEKTEDEIKREAQAIKELTEEERREISSLKGIRDELAQIRKILENR